MRQISVIKNPSAYSYNKSFWNSDNNPSLQGIQNKTDPNVIGKTTVEMKTQSTLTNVGWNFVGEPIKSAISKTWKILKKDEHSQYTNALMSKCPRPPAAGQGSQLRLL